MEELCHMCRGELLDKVPLDNKGHVAIDAGSKVRSESEGDKKLDYVFFLFLGRAGPGPSCSMAKTTRGKC